MMNNLEPAELGQAEIKVKPKASPKQIDASIVELTDLLARVDRLEAIICKLAHYGGGSYPSILREHGLEAYRPTLKDMSKQ